MKTAVSILLLMISLVPGAQAQDPDPDVYFPLQQGNQWTYYWVLHPPSGPDTSYTTVVLDEEVELDGKTYFHYRSRYIRSDGAGRILEYREDAEMVLFDFTVPPGETYVYEDAYVVTVSEEAYTTEAGTFAQARVLSFDIPGAVDDEFTYVFAAGVGVIAHWENWASPEFIFEAVIDGETVTALEPGAAAAPPALQVYPNPFADRVWIQLHDGVGPFGDPVTVTIHDLLGRRVRVVHAGRLVNETPSLRWDGRDESGRPVASGVYFVRVATEGRVLSRPVVHVR